MDSPNKWLVMQGFEVVLMWARIETVSPEGTFCDTVQVPSNGGDMELI